MATFDIVTKEEQQEIGRQLVEALYNNAPEEEIARLQIKLPLLPCLAMSLKETRGLEGLLESDFNLSDAVAEYGEDFLKL